MIHESDYGPDCCLVCPAIPVVVVSDPIGDQAHLCQPHWRDALNRSGGLIRAIRLYRPDANDQEGTV